MILPEKFDQNEWFVLISIILVLITILLLPKRFPLSVSILIILFGCTIGRLADRFLAAPYWDLYDIMDTNKYDFFDLLTYFLYGLFCYVFVYFFERLKIHGYKILVYIVVCSILGTTFEWIASIFKVFNYKEWKIYFSFDFYLAIQGLTVLYYFWIKNIFQIQTKRKILDSSQKA